MRYHILLLLLPLLYIFISNIVHYAARNGLTACVHELIARGVKLDVVNERKMSPADEAEEAKFTSLASEMEAKVVFSSGNNISSSVNTMQSFELEQAPEQGTHAGVDLKALRSLKDEMLIHVSDLLGVSLFMAEALLSLYDWNRETLLNDYITDPASCRLKAGLGDSKENSDNKSQGMIPSCAVCGEQEGPSEDDPEVPVVIVSLDCGHACCTECWQGYLHIKIRDGETNIACPGLVTGNIKCTLRVPGVIIERLVAPDMARKFLQFDLKTFVESCPDLKYCPSPGCSRVLQRKKEVANTVTLKIIPNYNSLMMFIISLYLYVL